jgi:hypothetical protein
VRAPQCACTFYADAIIIGTWPYPVLEVSARSEDETMSETKTYPLRLPRSGISKEKGTSINQFVATAVAEKVSVLETATRSSPAHEAQRALACFHATVLRLFKNRKATEIGVREENVACGLQPSLSFFGEHEPG